MSPRPEVLWPQYKAELLRRLRDEQRLSYGRIAKHMGISRSAVAGKDWRMGGNGVKDPADRLIGRRPSHRWTETALTERWADRKQRLSTGARP
jgi:hypothetical protein